MKKILFRIGSACGLALLLIGSSNAHAFCTEYELAGIGLNCVDEGHKLATKSIQPFIDQEIWHDIWRSNFAQDDPAGEFAADGQRHFESCRFVPAPFVLANIPYVQPGSIDYINRTYSDIITNLNPADPDHVLAAAYFGNLLHTVQDFYAHTNWINLLNLSSPNPVGPADLFDGNLQAWEEFDWLGPIRDDIILGQIPPLPYGLPPGWSVTQDANSETPIFTTAEGTERRGLITGWNENGACPDVREGTTQDGFSHEGGFLDPVTGQPVFGVIPRTNRLVHGESKISGQYDWNNRLLKTFDADRPCHDDHPTALCINKDSPGRPDYEQAIQLAEYQTAHEWCRLLHLAKDSQFGYSAAGILMAMWTKPGDDATASAPHPITTACGTPPEVAAGKPGPIEVTVNPRGVGVDRLPTPDGPPGKRTISTALFTGDFRRSIRREFEGLTDENVLITGPMTMCVKPDDELVVSVWGFDDWREPPPEGPHLYAGTRMLRGETLVLDGPAFLEGESEGEEGDRDLSANFEVIVGGDDPDADGLTSACGEPFYGTDPIVADTDRDGLDDGAEVNTYGTNPVDEDSDDDGLYDGPEVNTYGTNPLDSDTDDDELTDGDEVNVYHTNPLDSDSDDDGLTDGAEVNTYRTDPNKADTDNDGLPDGIEVRYGSDPLDSDTDNDGLLDGKDVEWIENFIAGIPNAAIKSPAAGNRNAMLNLLNDAEALLLKGNLRAALDKLSTLRRRIDGCGVVSDGNDWIVDCAIQTELRLLVDLLITNASA